VGSDIEGTARAAPEVEMSVRSLAVLLLLAGDVTAAESLAPPSQAKAVFAGGCFWCMEGPFDALPGVAATTSGYTGGTKPKPTYAEVSAGTSGHLEAIEVTYDPRQVSYERLLEVFWRNVDPFDGSGQFCDKGPQYRSAVFVRDERERKLAEASKRAVEARFGKTVATEVLPASVFWPAEDYHQDYATKNPVRYKYYRYSCGRDARLKAVWGAQAGAEAPAR
jgi:peptide-methionine (S)-S-oxide reductase